MNFKSIVGATCACLVALSFNVSAAFIDSSGALPEAYLSSGTESYFKEGGGSGIRTNTYFLSVGNADSYYTYPKEQTEELSLYSSADDGATSITQTGIWNGVLDSEPGAFILELYPDPGFEYAKLTVSLGVNQSLSIGCEINTSCYTTGESSAFVSINGVTVYDQTFNETHGGVASYSDIYTYYVRAGDTIGMKLFTKAMVSGEISAYPSSSSASVSISFQAESSNGPSSVVPIPAAVWLFGSGLLGLVGMARRKANA